VILLDVPSAVGLARLEKRVSKRSAGHAAKRFYDRVREGYLALAK
jgi:thymidylate kinase